MEITSPAFHYEEQIPKRYTCEGEDISPQLDIGGVPLGAQSLALIVEDPDAPMGTFDHWVAWNISPKVSSLEEGYQEIDQGTNGFRVIGYRGPCPPPGKPHRYFFKLYALDKRIDLLKGASKEELKNEMEGHILERAELMGTFQR